MPSFDSVPDSAPYDYPTEFARLLASFRSRAGFSTRELAERAGCSHSQIVRATTGRKVPTWNVASGFLGACGFGTDALIGWQAVWQVARDAERELARGHPPVAGREWFWLTAKRGWVSGLQAVSRPNPILVILADLLTPEALGIAIKALAERSDLRSVRDIAEAAGVPKTTMHRWLNGMRTPTAPQLKDLVVALRATPEECDAFLNGLRRLGESPCAEPHPHSGLLCVRDRRHRGWHSTAAGTSWLDDGESYEMVMRDFRSVPGPVISSARAVRESAPR